MVFPKPKASSFTISPSPEESRVGQVDSRESLDPSSSSATSPPHVQVFDSSEPFVACVQVFDSSEPLVACVQVFDSSEPLVACVQVIDSIEPLVACVQVIDSIEPLEACVQVIDSCEPLVPTGAIKPTADVQVVETPVSPTHTEPVANPMSSVPGISHWDDSSYAPRLQGGLVSGIMPDSLTVTFTEESGSSRYGFNVPKVPVSGNIPDLPVSPTFTEESGHDEERPGSPTHTEPLEAGMTGAQVSHATLLGSSGRRLHLYAEEIKNQWNFRRILQVFHSVDASVQFAEERGMLAREKMCTQHKKPMILENSGQLGIFRCRKSNCRRKAESRAKGTWFEQIRICITMVFEMMYMFTSGFTYEQVQRETTRPEREQVVSEHTIADWYSYCRETIAVYELEHDEERPKIGGPGKIVQIDESKFGRRKYNRGRHVEGHWVLGMIEDGSDDLRVVVCPDNVRSAEVLVPLIKKHVEEGSTIHTDMWRAYNSLPQHNYIHKIVNHSDPDNRFVAPDGTHTQRIESHWRGLKRHFHKDNYKGNFEDWLIEFTWRRRIRINKLDPFEELLKCINYVYKLE